MKITVLGKGIVGKSSMIFKYIDYNTPKEHDPTIEDKFSKVTVVNGITCHVEILDTAGQDDYQSLLNYWISFAEAFILVYAINDRESFDYLDEKRDRILKMKKDVYCPIILVGNKSDLENQRKIQYDEGVNLAKRWGCYFFETSVLVIKLSIFLFILFYISLKSLIIIKFINTLLE